MSESWAYALANEFKKRNNINTTKIGACVGRIESLSPLIVSIQSGLFMIQQENIYVAYHILERSSSFREYEAEHNQSGKITTSFHPGQGTYTEEGSISAKGTVILEQVMKVGDYCIMIPNESEQKFFMVDILRTLNGYNIQLG